ncbi:type II toxin-antitoxin system RatA family toxin [Thiomicrospira microaerophila]|uniref:type II toxin-antitoxin system RatA family toxin n=1 Tax=Thiomicrospira microaerophila TaxID=406020 RepID=UPI0005C8E42E|nr:type II toxin-antitoxin system RatA family toxin [Thiomicrospira microaerophila]
MKKISRTALLNYSARQMYQVVNDVALYPTFLPWCSDAQVHRETDAEMQASITISKLGINKTFSTSNHLTPNERIEMRLVDGPFSFLQGEWVFKALGDQACKISFEIEFEVSSGLMGSVLGGVFEQIAGTLVESFVARATNLYGGAQ